MKQEEFSGVGKLNESSLHNSLKFLYSKNKNDHEKKVGRYHIDVKLADELVEIQIKNLGKIRNKLESLLRENQVRLVHPMYAIKYIKKFESDGRLVSRRKSPKQGKVLDSFYELLRIASLLGDKNLRVDIVLVEIEESWINDGKGSWRRRGWSKSNKELIQIIDRISLETKRDYLDLLPEALPENFTTTDIKNLAKIPLGLAQKMCYTYAKAGFITQVGKKGNSKLYQIQ